jgi:hypothetical protein
VASGSPKGRLTQLDLREPPYTKPRGPSFHLFKTFKLRLKTKAALSKLPEPHARHLVSNPCLQVLKVLRGFENAFLAIRKLLK